MNPFKLACVEAELNTSKEELRDITKMYMDAEESRQRHMVRQPRPRVRVHNQSTNL